MSILSEIAADVRYLVEREKKRNPLEEEDIHHSGGRSLRESIESNSRDTSVIGELKRKSPSRGEIRSDFRVRELAEDIAQGGAIGISVLTEPVYFDGQLDFLKEVREAVDLPVLRKDFIVDEYQLYQSAKVGADAVLLITELLGENLPEFVEKAEELGMEPLVEVRNKEQVDLARQAEADMIGINNRNLRTMEVDLSKTEELLDYTPKNSVSVSESGVETREDVERILENGADAVLVGTAIMESEDVKKKTQRLVSGES